jgi:hypothetical protein
MTLVTQPVRVGTGAEEEGCLVFSDDRLVAVLVRLSDVNEIAPGEWFFETGFGPLGGPEHPTSPASKRRKNTSDRGSRAPDQSSGHDQRACGDLPIGITADVVAGSFEPA